MAEKIADKEDLFVERYNKLNERQREAVDTIYGPVMVVAGPGTGKTEVLAMRIANLLRSEAQVQPGEILCLTYTDEATNAMRKRLVQITGPAAHKVNIFTFHAFCNNVIQNNGDYFSTRTLQPIDELERADMMHGLVEELPQGHPLRRLSGDLYYDTRRLTDLFGTMKREHLMPEYISEQIDAYLESLPEREEYVYKRNGNGFKKGDLKQAAIDDEKARMETTRAAALLYHTYQQKMQDTGRYDFNDMILWVLDAFGKHPALLQSYQERYQYILVDEFQDTNGSQNEVLTYLSSYWDNPNVFVVGDDDQSIYEFQGARIRNIIDFYERHKEGIRVIVLPHNYRSSQAVIDKAMAAIGNNKQRLINQLHELKLDKNILSANDRFKDGNDTVQPIITAYPNILQEEAAIVQQIEALKEKGVPLQEIAVLYAQHKQADNIIALMERKGIPYNVKKPVDVLAHRLVEQLRNILSYLEAERKKSFEREDILFEIMHAPYFGIEPTDIATLALYMQHNKKELGPLRWRLLLSNPLLIESLNLKSAKALHRLGNNLDDWEKQQIALPLPLLVEKIVHESGMVAHLLKGADHVWDMQALHTFFEFVKENYAKNQRIRPAGLLQTMERMNKEKIVLPLERVVQSDKGVYFYTAHSAKGNEFEHVFIVGCTKNYWEKKKGNNNGFRLPDTITATKDDNDTKYMEEVARRLFYVALTRAKKHLHLSYAQQDNTGKPLEYSQFIDEISTPEERQSATLPAAEVTDFMKWAMQPVEEKNIKIANGEWIDKMLAQFTMSVTQLTKYLRCPLTFYYETILKVPTQKNDSLAFGSAVHYALERMYLDMKLRKGEFPPKEDVLAAFTSALYSEAGSMGQVQFERRMEMGLEILGEYYDSHIATLHKNVEIEYKIPRYYLEGVPVTGKIDKIELHGDSCTVVDYKTGDPDSKWAAANLKPPSEADPIGGDYWRQIVFYKLLIDNYDDRNWRVTTGIFEYIQKNKSGEYKLQTVPVFAADEATVRQQLKGAYTDIMGRKFDKGCGKEDCHWCNFAKRYELIRDVGAVEMDDV